MNNRFLGIITLVMALALSACQPQEKVADNILEYVDPFIGTGFHGHTFPGATLPFGMVQLSPDTHLDGWEASSGYHYDDTKIYAFSHTHLSGTGIGDLGDVGLLPYSNTTESIPAATFSKEKENAAPGHYSVHLDNFNIDVELTTTLRVGMHKYTYGNTHDRNVMLNLAHVLQANWGNAITGNECNILDEQTIEGIQLSTGWAHDHLVAYRIEFSEPFIQKRIMVDGEEKDLTKVNANDAQIYLTFNESDKPLLVKVAISAVDPSGAHKNMQAELPGWNFEQTLAKAQSEWQKQLEQIHIETNDAAVKTNFYTAMYHSMMAPFIWQDVDGRYRGMDKQIHQAAEGHVNYTVFSLWDTFRAFHPLMTIIQPDKASIWAEALVQKYKEGGILPKWPLVSNYTGTMVGYPAVSVLADAAAKGLGPDDLSEWLEASVQSATWRPDIVERFKGTREAAVMPKHIYFKETLGWVPSDSVAEAVSYGLEMAYYDWCVGQIAKAADETKTASEFMAKSEYFRHYFDPTTGLMRGRNYDGSWVTPFRPRYSSHEKSDYVEGNAWQWSFFTPHANEQLIELYGSVDRFEAMMDTLFTTDSGIEGEHASADITGLIGQYAHGNEPSHHMAYLYNWTNAPYKANERLDQIMREFYLPEPAGIIGNEDCGQMSAWYVMSALGFYQICPGDATYTTGRPMVDKAIINLPQGTLEIIAHNNSPENMYVEKVVLNGKVLDKPFFTHDQLLTGGQLEFFMTSEK
ncbi:GH92 family glycosyl hydrolase [Carboxylicivirga sediminis]|uniref:GH92 family glycosyl hydrolase n=1 Tax=Carboxylicivirga sediminis TaxID=2006564 RepID=A0A941F282_9BACT|nr:GH92 family glycosyl hydrolase [Carboxylicivirga sediminis]MBR8535012.1 GH92 family glycosyl hydrolase [Carboxylicivirga sediminis]